MLQLGIAPKETFLGYSTQFVFLRIRLLLENVVMVAIDMCRKNPITGEWIYGITWSHVYFNISVLFIVDTMFILKEVFLNYFLIESTVWIMIVIIVFIKLGNLLNNAYCENKNIKNTFLNKRYFTAYVAFSSSIKIEIFHKVT